jgi:hypothetical protein
MTLRHTIAYSLFCLMDHLVWLMIQLLPGPVLLKLIKQRPWRRLQFQLSRFSQELWFRRFCWLLARRYRKAGWASTCLSRSLCGRILLDLIGVSNQIHLGMCKLVNGHKIPHAWLTVDQNFLTPGLSSRGGAYFTDL